MEKEKKTYRGTETDFVLQWGSKKRLRCVKLKKDQSLANKSKPSDALPKKKLSSRFATAEKESPSRLPKIKWMKFVDHKFYPKNQASHSIRCSFVNALHDRKSSVLSPEKEDRYYTTRGSLGLDDNGKVLMDNFKEDKGLVWPKLVLSLSSKEKEEDFMAMKGCKPPQRPKKRAKLIQRTILLVSPGAWLSDLCQERYEVREKKSSKKRPSGLKAMGSMESNSE